jgi:hypothetical protein
MRYTITMPVTINIEFVDLEAIEIRNTSGVFKAKATSEKFITFKVISREPLPRKTA